ncbi:MAG: hypothetical protein AAFO94_18345 [Bacteroidota bacterium]
MTEHSLTDRIYPSKLLLFGEHTVNTGSQALAMPLELYRGQWCKGDDAAHPSRPYLEQTLDYLEQLQKKDQLLVAYDLAGFRQMLHDGLHFDSNIPIGYGLGSSGALTAGIYDAFCVQKSDDDLAALKKQLAQIESLFHGESSGTDPLVSFLQQGVYIESRSELGPVNIPTSTSAKAGLFLLNTGQPRRADHFIQLYFEQCEAAWFQQRVAAELVPCNDHAIDAFLKADWAALFELMHQISLFQYRYFEAFIPEALRPIWLKGLAGDQFKLKICGAGGGGFMMGVCRDFTKVESEVVDFELTQVFGF